MDVYTLADHYRRIDQGFIESPGILVDGMHGLHGIGQWDFKKMVFCDEHEFVSSEPDLRFSCMKILSEVRGHGCNHGVPR